jgi:excisionase family DNA binding protein
LTQGHAPAGEVELRADDASVAVTLPRQAVKGLLELLGQIANGNAVTILPVHAELSTQQAADFLNVSRPYLVGLLETGTIPFVRVGAHRRIKAADVIAYRQSQEARSKALLDQLAADAQELGMGY